MAKFLNLLLLLLLIGGVVRVCLQAIALKGLAEEHARLTAIHGELDVKDPSKFLVTAVDTGDPMHFKWRIYYPAGVRVERRTGFGVQSGGGSSVTTSSREALHQVRFEFGKQGQLRAHALFNGGGSSRGYGHRAVASFLKEHWSELEVTRLGDQGPIEIPVDRPLELLTIRLPANLHAEFGKRVGKKLASHYRNPVYGASYGTLAAFKWLDKKKSEKARE